MLSESDNKHSLEVYIGDLSSKDIIDMFLDQVGKEGLNCVEMLGETRLRAYFTESVDVERFLNESVVIKDMELFFFRGGEKLKTVFVKGLPFNLPAKSLYDVITKYGKVRSIGYERHAGYKPLCTGTRILKMKLCGPIPNFIRVGRYTAVVTYRNQVLVCRRCGGKGHLAKGCNTAPEDFQTGFPVHIRPIAPRTGNQACHSKRMVNVAVQTVDTLSNAVVASGGNLSSVQTSTSKKTSKKQTLNGGAVGNPNKSSGASSSCTKSSHLPTEKLQQKDNGRKEVLCVEENLLNQGVPADSTELASSLSSLAIGGVSTITNVTEVNEWVTTGKKKKKKKKKPNK